MKLPPLEEAIFLERVGRFLGKVELGVLPSANEIKGKEILVHIPNSGRLPYLLKKGNIVYLRKNKGRTEWSVFSVKIGESVSLPLVGRHARSPLASEQMVIVDSFVGEKLFEEELRKGKPLPFIGKLIEWRKAPRFRGVTFDFLIIGESGRFLVEQKSSTLLEGETAYFPDAPTERGYRQLVTLKQAVQERFTPLLIMIVKHPRAKRFSFAHHIDPRFAEEAEHFVRDFPFLCFKIAQQGSDLSLVPM